MTIDHMPTVRKFRLTNGCKKRLVAFFGHTDDSIADLENNRQWIAAKQNDDGSFKVQSPNHNGTDCAFVCIETQGLFLALGITSPVRERRGPTNEEVAERKAQEKATRDANRARDEARAELNRKAKDQAKREHEERMAATAKAKAERHAAHLALMEKLAKEKAERIAKHEAANPSWTAKQKAEYWIERAKQENL